MIKLECYYIWKIKMLNSPASIGVIGVEFASPQVHSQVWASWIEKLGAGKFSPLNRQYTELGSN
jgi:hypothetical protein